MHQSYNRDSCGLLNAEHHSLQFRSGKLWAWCSLVRHGPVCYKLALTWFEGNWISAISKAEPLVSSRRLHFQSCPLPTVDSEWFTMQSSVFDVTTTGHG